MRYTLEQIKRDTWDLTFRESNESVHNKPTDVHSQILPFLSNSFERERNSEFGYLDG